MELRGYLDALRLRWWLVAGLAVLGAVVGLTAFLLTPPVYASSVTFYVSVPPEPDQSAASATQYAQAKVSSYVALVGSEEAARRVVADQGLDASPASVASSVTASAQLNTSVITASVRSGSAERSAAVARGLANTFGPLVRELDDAGRTGDVVRVDVVSGPTSATAPVSPQLRHFLVLGLLAGLVLGALLAVLRDLLDVTVRSSAATAEVVGAPTLAVVDDEPDPRGRAEAVRQLRTGLTLRRGTGDPAARCRRAGRGLRGGRRGQEHDGAGPVPLVRRGGGAGAPGGGGPAPPRARRHLGLPPGPGLSEVLSGAAEAADAVAPGGADGLSVLPAGMLPPHPAELLASARMADLVVGLRASYDQVVLDVPPVLPVTDAVVCAALADGVLVVVRWGRSRRPDVVEAVGVLEQAGAPVLGGVLVGGAGASPGTGPGPPPPAVGSAGSAAGCGPSGRAGRARGARPAGRARPRPGPGGRSTR